MPPASSPTASPPSRRSGWSSRRARTARAGTAGSGRTRSGTARRPGRPAFRFAHLGADLDDLAHELVAEHVALAHRRDEAVVEVQVRPADRGGRDPHDRVARVQDVRVGHLVYLDVMLVVPAVRSHRFPLAKSSYAAAAAGRPGFMPNNPSLASDRAISPVSITCLKRRRSSCSCCPGSSPNSDATADPRRPPGGWY